MVETQEIGLVCALGGCRPDGKRQWAMTKEMDVFCSECAWRVLEPALRASQYRGRPGTKFRGTLRA